MARDLGSRSVGQRLSKSFSGHASERFAQPADQAPQLFEISARQRLSRILELGASLLGAPHAAIVKVADSSMRFIAGVGFDLDVVPIRWSFEAAGYSPEEIVAFEDTSSNRCFARIPVFGQLYRYFVHAPINRDRSGHWTCMIFGAKHPRQRPGDAQTRFIRRLAAIAAAEIDLLDSVTGFLHRVALGLWTADDVGRIIATSSLPAALIDASGRIHATSESGSRLFKDERHGFSDARAAAGRESLVRALARFLELANTPLMTEAALPSSETPEPRTYVIGVAPLSQFNDGAKYGAVVAIDVSQARDALTAVESAIHSPLRIGDTVANWPSVEFLLSTLVRRRSIRKRNGATYLALRQWRAAVKKCQLNAMRALKLNPDPTFVSLVSDELAVAAREVFGAKQFAAVAPIPCGHSRSVNCLSVLLARAVAARLRTPMIETFEPMPSPGVSHPRENLKRDSLRLRVPAPGPLLLLDDVATSGQHIGEAQSLLLPSAGVVHSLVWIGGDAA